MIDLLVYYPCPSQYQYILFHHSNYPGQHFDGRERREMEGGGGGAKEGGSEHHVGNEIQQITTTDNNSRQHY